MNSIEENPNVIFLIVFSSLYRISKEHWNWAIMALIHNMLKVFMEITSTMYDELTATYKSEGKERKGAWRIVRKKTGGSGVKEKS